MGPAYFREAAQVINAAGGGAPDRAMMMEIFRRHGMTMTPPPRQAAAGIRPPAQQPWNSDTTGGKS
jgi:hypothetical protein